MEKGNRKCCSALTLSLQDALLLKKWRLCLHRCCLCWMGAWRVGTPDAVGGTAPAASDGMASGRAAWRAWLSAGPQSHDKPYKDVGVMHRELGLGSEEGRGRGHQHRQQKLRCNHCRLCMGIGTSGCGGRAAQAALDSSPHHFPQHVQLHGAHVVHSGTEPPTCERKRRGELAQGSPRWRVQLLGTHPLGHQG